VGGLAANGFGVFDLVGNVRVQSLTESARVSDRSADAPGNSSPDVGFRCARRP